MADFTMVNNKQELETVLEANAQFAKDLYNLLSADSGNVFFSPISVHAVLSLAYQAAQGPTKDALSTSLHVRDPDVAAQGYKSVMSLLNNTQDVQLFNANKIYISEGYKLSPSFQETAQKQFLSDVAQINFTNNVQAADAINSWVEGKTNNKIKNIVSPDSLLKVRAVLVNAIYFKGGWLDKFHSRNTQTEQFYLNDDETVECQMMYRMGLYKYKRDRDLDAQVLEMPYKNRDFSLIVILPKVRNGIDNLEAKLSETNLTKITEALGYERVIVRLPKFKMESTINLNNALSKMGLGVMFVPIEADFSGMIESSEPLYVSEVIQKACIEVNEKGTKAAAATRYQEIPVCMPPQFRADHPFIIVLQARHGNTSNILFKGRVSHPVY